MNYFYIYFKCDKSYKYIIEWKGEIVSNYEKYKCYSNVDNN